jgi:glycosyltransferase involved in cell wall biosynthesis
MAAATPLVATAVGGIPDVVTDGKTGLLVPPRDSTVLATAIERVITDHQLGRRLATAAATGLGPFTIDSVARRFADLYEELATERNAEVINVDIGRGPPWPAHGSAVRSAQDVVGL